MSIISARTRATHGAFWRSLTVYFCKRVWYNTGMASENSKTVISGAAVSGGVDSMVMLDLLLKEKKNVVVVNVEHGIRGDASVGDSKFVAEYCRSRGVDCLTFSVDAPAYARENNVSIELAARMLRYEIFDKLLKEKTVDEINLAHHLNDQVETMLMRMFRGTGIRGLRGIVDREGYRHPLIGYTKQEIIDYAVDNGIPYREDATNLETRYTRNYIRHEICPQIKTRFPHYERALLRLARHAEEVEDYMLTMCVPPTVSGFETSLPIAALETHPAIAKKTVAEAFRAMGYLHDIDSAHLSDIIALVKAENGSMVNLPFGIDAIRNYNRVSLVYRESKEEMDEPYADNGYYEFGPFSYEFKPTDELVKRLTFDPDKIPEGARVRTREAGDEFRRCGGKNKTLSDYLTDLKMPKNMRDKLLVIACGKRVYAVLGVEIAEEVKIDENSVRMVKIEIGENYYA